jgi:hypothetical protein
MCRPSSALGLQGYSRVGHTRLAWYTTLNPFSAETSQNLHELATVAAVFSSVGLRENQEVKRALMPMKVWVTSRADRHETLLRACFWSRSPRPLENARISGELHTCCTKPDAKTAPATGLRLSNFTAFNSVETRPCRLLRHALIYPISLHQNLTRPNF